MMQSQIFRNYQMLRGKNGVLAQLLYLQMVRSWPFYGCTFFLATPDPPPQGTSDRASRHGTRGGRSDQVERTVVCGADVHRLL